MIIGKSRKELEKMRAAGRLVGLVREHVRRLARPGVTTLELDRAAERMIRDAGALPTFKGYNGYPFSICASVNEQVVHGFPSNYALRDGDIISVDIGVTLNGFVGDTATTIPIGNVRPDWLELIRISEECLERAIEQCRHGRHLGDIGWAVQQHAEAHGYSVVREYVGHGIGRKMHEDPQIPNYGKPGTGAKIKAGYVFAVEPMINLGTHHTKTLADGWTVVTVDGQPSVHVEHTVAVTEEGPEVLTRMAEIAEPQPQMETSARV
ncbi:MAG: type I methionyl aminopeptidase [Pyrinomonadaceae bacterium]|nr:type I methionyl aminopeptidase [Pyrinomonadaceae bacterium]MDQ3584680.1 type I methionyl aminopeptidase [Acidobacteriota bacterium]